MKAEGRSLPDPKDKISLLPRINQGLSLTATRHFDEAISIFRELMRENPESEAVRALLGFTCVMAGQYQMAEDLYRELLRTFGEYADYHYNLAYVLLRTNRAEEGLRELDAALKIEPSHSGATNQKAVILLRDGRPADAVKLLEALIQRTPYDQLARFNLAQGYGQMRRFGDAARELETLLRLNPRHPKAAYWLGIAYAQLGRRQDAARALQAYLKMNPKAPDAQEVQQQMMRLLTGK
jgi:tetratricopeptide (TPR) repeat protein